MEICAAIERTAAGEHGVKFCERPRGADAAEARQRCGAAFRRVHRRDAVQPLGRSEGAQRERTRRDECAVKTILRRRGFRRENRRDRIRHRGRHTDPKIQPERLGERTTPVRAERLTAHSADEFIEEKSVKARPVAVRRTRLPMRLLRGDGLGDRAVIEDRNRAIQHRHAGLVRERLRKSHALFSALRKLRPHVGNRRVQRDAALLHRVQNARGGGSLRRAPHEHGSLRGPRRGLLPVAPAVGERHDFPTVLPDIHGRAEIPEAGEILAE